jgi:hypothetical protein
MQTVGAHGISGDKVQKQSHVHGKRLPLMSLFTKLVQSIADRTGNRTLHIE